MEKLFRRADTLATSKRQKCSARLLSPEGFLQLTADEVERATRYDRPLSVALILIDRLPMIRKADGAAVAEQVFAEATAKVIHSLRGPDRTGRLGPAQLGVLLPETGLQQGATAVERLRGALKADPIATASGPRSISLTAGVAALSTRRRDPKALLMAACFELRRAQAEGRDRVAMAPPDTAILALLRSRAVH